MEHNPEHTHSAKENVLAKIREKRLTMRPKILFGLEAVLAGFVALVILAVSVAIVNYILFAMRVNGHEALLGFGPRGLHTFLFVFPWPLLVIDGVLIFFLEVLLRRFKFGYRSPMLYLLFALLVIAIGTGTALDRGTSMNDALLHQAEHGGLPPPFGELYEHVRAPAPHERGIYRGTITAIGTTTLTLAHDDLDKDSDETGYTVMLPPGFDTGTLTVGERVYVAGEMHDTHIRAFGVHQFPHVPEIVPTVQP